MSTYRLRQLRAAFLTAWCAETAFDASVWTAANPARGQCVASALVTQYFFGGDLARFEVTGRYTETHWCNVTADGAIFDLTAAQYPADGSVSLRRTAIDLKGFASARDKRLADADTKRRYELLLARVQSVLGSPMA